jgi:predicted alpha/beta-fold hydrolase
MPPRAADFPAFSPRFPWRGRDAQTLRNFLIGPRVSPADRGGERLDFEMPDGTGDRLCGDLSRPLRSDGERPLIVLIHGLSGCEESPYMLASARYFLSLGYPVLRLNLRGSVPTQPHCREHYHAGRGEDLAAVLEQLGNRAEAAAGIVPIGFSLGGNMLLGFLARRGADVPIPAAISVSAPIDLAGAAERFLQPRNRFYHAWILRHMKRDALAARDLDPRKARAIQGACTIYEFDDRVVAPGNGFASAQEYYRQCSAARYLAEISVPTLVIHALDDPWIPASAYLDVSWEDNPNLTPLLCERGGHVGFHDAAGTWHNRMAERFIARASSREA